MPRYEYIQALCRYDQTGEAFKGVSRFITVPVDNRIKPFRALLNLFSGRSYVVERFDVPAYREALIQLLQEKDFDIIHIDGLPPCAYIDTLRAHSGAKLSLRAHNVEYKLWERASVADANPLKRWYIAIQSSRLRAFEAYAMGAVDLVLAISQEDERLIHELQPRSKTLIVPAGMDIDENKPVIQPGGLSLFHIGAMDWLPESARVGVVS
jgi:glycosyltransferase involved in cell wall biosynthesis